MTGATVWRTALTSLSPSRRMVFIKVAEEFHDLTLPRLNGG